MKNEHYRPTYLDMRRQRPEGVMTPGKLADASVLLTFRPCRPGLARRGELCRPDTGKAVLAGLYDPAVPTLKQVLGQVRNFLEFRASAVAEGEKGAARERFPPAPMRRPSPSRRRV